MLKQACSRRYSGSLKLKLVAEGSNAHRIKALLSLVFEHTGNKWFGVVPCSNLYVRHVLQPLISGHGLETLPPHFARRLSQPPHTQNASGRHLLDIHNIIDIATYTPSVPHASS